MADGRSHRFRRILIKVQNRFKEVLGIPCPIHIVPQPHAQNDNVLQCTIKSRVITIARQGWHRARGHRWVTRLYYTPVTQIGTRCLRLRPEGPSMRVMCVTHVGARLRQELLHRGYSMRRQVLDEPCAACVERRHDRRVLDGELLPRTGWARELSTGRPHQPLTLLVIELVVPLALCEGLCAARYLA